MASVGAGDWAFGIAQPLRLLALGGAADIELERFINARKHGDMDQASRILNAVRLPHAPPSPNPLAAASDPLERVASVALKLVVNEIDTRLLMRYIEVVWYVSKHVVATLGPELFLSSDRAVDTVGRIVAKFALDKVTCPRRNGHDSN